MAKMNCHGSLGLKTIIFLWVANFFVSTCIITEGRHISKEDYLKAKRSVKCSRRPTIKSIHLEDGDIYDCVLIEKQLAFEHPALKNHIIQLKPTSIPQFVKNDKSSNHTHPYIGLKGGVGSGPVTASGEFCGTKGLLNVWNPRVKAADQFSLSQLWVTNGGNETIEAGWHVYPQLFGGDNRTRLFVYWTNDYYQHTGCYNLVCPGFVQVSTKVPVGVALEQVSTYQGNQYGMDITVVKLEDGDIYDCVPIEKELAFEHPALKNHTIQMKPTSIPDFVKKDESSNHTRPYIGLKGGGCPVGSVPVRRLQIEDILRSPSVKSFGRKNSVIWAAVEASGEFYGTRGSLNIWNPSVKSAGQFSLSQLWVINGDNEIIEAGWHTDNYDKTGCYNTLCPGFVQVSTKVAVGVTLDQVSTYHGHEYEMELTVVKDAKTKNWWIYYSKEPVGYWPSSLYKGLGSGAANAVNWGGEALSPNTKGQWPPMGSSHFPLTNGDNIGKSCFISNIQISKKDSSWDNYPLNATVYQDAPRCSILEGRHISKEDYLEAKRLMKRSRRSSIKSIHLEDGDIYDCVPIEKQLAFEHPALKNHTIQLKPTSIPEFVKNDKSSNHTRPYIGLKDGGCPIGLVPVRRLQIEEILSSPSLKSFGRKDSAIPSEHRWAVVRASGDFYGTSGVFNVWNPIVKAANEFSLSQLWVINGGVETIEAGWHVYPQLFGGDNRTRFFVYWTSDTYKSTGCYNLICPGFVQVSTKTPVGLLVDPVSTLQGNKYDFSLRVEKDAKTSNWWIYYQDEAVGYWPSSLYKGLGSGGATRVDWGGEVANPNTNVEWPPMGSGNFPDKNGANYANSCYISNLSIFQKDSTWDEYPLSPELFISKSECYNIVDYGWIDTQRRRVISYGGPGGSC
ncbi:uncharacterized protein LOC122092337 [Macadamia integrifolia]|uniref:uncharacterized protein LOC122092337 n=1 Tax=Macadamia integrifolia TaxID=60698 RepID=UPI001C52F677|nr:uncharacterized protein LOC122092337 [Macadamia integrifolia]